MRRRRPRPVIRLALRDLGAHRSRFLLTTLAVTVGVAFVVGSFTLTDSLRSAFGGSIDELNSGTDLVVRRHAYVGRHFWEAEPFDAAIVDTLADVDGVESALPGVGASAHVTNPTGGHYNPAGPELGISWLDSSDSPLTLVEGRRPGPGEVTLDVTTAEAMGHRVDHRLISSNRPFTICLINFLTGAKAMPTKDHLVQVARSVRRDLDRDGKPFVSIWRFQLTERLREVSGEGSTRLKAALGADLERALNDQGLRCYPSLTDTSTDDKVRLFRAGSAVGDLIDAVLVPSPDHDRELARALARYQGTWEGEPHTAEGSAAEMMRRVLPREKQVAFVRSLDDPDLATT